MNEDEEKQKVILWLVDKMCTLYTEGLRNEALRLLSFIVDVFNLTGQ